MVSDKTPVYRPLLNIAVSFAIGIFLCKHVRIPFFVPCLLALASLACSAAFMRKKSGYVFILLSFVFLGFASAANVRYQSRDHVALIARYYKKTPVRIEGVIVSDVHKRVSSKGTKTVFQLEVKRFKTKWGWKTKSGRVLVNVFRGIDVVYGDYVELEGKIFRPFNFTGRTKFSYRRYLENRGIGYIVSVRKNADITVVRSGAGNPVKTASIRLKNFLKGILSRYLPKAESGMMQALILGDRYDIPKPVADLFVKTGTAHIWAISGFNVGIVAFIIFLVLKILPLSRRWQLLVAIFLLAGYAFLTGSKPPVVRATIMATVFLFSFLAEREADPLNSLALSALIILGINPSDLFDVGFQLSFISVLTIILFYGRILRGFKRIGWDLEKKPLLFLAQSLALSLSAWVGVAGLVAYYFDIVTPVTVMTNVVVVPLISLIVVLGFCLLAAGWVFPYLAATFASLIKLLFGISISCIYLFSRIPGAYFYTDNSPFSWVIIYYLLLASAVALLSLLPPTKHVDKEAQL